MVVRLSTNIALFGLMAVLLAACGSSHGSDQSAQIQAKLGSNATCYESQYQIENRLDGSKQPVYVCETPGSKVICATWSDGIASNVTAEVRILFQSTLGQEKPACVK